MIYYTFGDIYLKISIRQMTMISFFSALTAAGAFISIPIQPVPFSLQTLFTLLAGMMLGSVSGALSQIIYILLGVIGLPVFAGFKSGLGILLGPTGGFLFGFVIAAYIVGKITEIIKEMNIFYYFFIGCFGILIIYLIGIAQLSIVASIEIKKALVIGALPYFPGDILKVIAASFMVNKLKVFIDK